MQRAVKSATIQALTSLYPRLLTPFNFAKFSSCFFCLLLVLILFPLSLSEGLDVSSIPSTRSKETAKDTWV